MTYVIIHGRGLQGLGATSDQKDQAVRALTGAKFSELQSAWAKKLDDAITGKLGIKKIFSSPGVTVISVIQQRAALTKARQDVLNLMTFVQPVLLDTSLSSAEVVRRVEEFSANYGANLDAQIQLADNASQRATFRGQVDAFKEGLRIVVNEVIDTADAALPDADDSPWLYVGGAVAGLVGLAYVWRSFR
jgi:hypothetical protein